MNMQIAVGKCHSYIQTNKNEIYGPIVQKLKPPTLQWDRNIGEIQNLPKMGRKWEGTLWLLTEVEKVKF